MVLTFNHECCCVVALILVLQHSEALKQSSIAALELVAVYPIATHQVMLEVSLAPSTKHCNVSTKALQNIVLLHPCCGCYRGSPSIAINVNWWLYVVSYVTTKWIYCYHVSSDARGRQLY